MKQNKNQMKTEIFWKWDEVCGWCSNNLIAECLSNSYLGKQWLRQGFTSSTSLNIFKPWRAEHMHTGWCRAGTIQWVVTNLKNKWEQYLLAAWVNLWSKAYREEQGTRTSWLLATARSHEASSEPALCRSCCIRATSVCQFKCYRQKSSDANDQANDCGVS